MCIRNKHFSVFISTTRQKAANKQTFDLNGKIEIEGKPGKLVKSLKINKLLIRSEKLKLREKTRQNTENKQTFDLNGKIKLRKKKLVETLKINKLI